MLMLTLLAVLLAFSVSAACYDSDDGPKNLATPARYLGSDGFVTEGNTTYYDTCVSRAGGSEIDDGLWIREYYCDNSGRVAFEDFFCPSHYYVECLTVHKAAACDDYSGPADYNETSAVNTTATANTTNTTSQGNITNTTSGQSNASRPVNCGDKKVEFGEECDPPGKDCYTKAMTKGICDFSCECDASLTPALFKKLNQSMNQEEQASSEITAAVTFDIQNTTEEGTGAVQEVKAERKNRTTAGITGGAVTDPLDDLLDEARSPAPDFDDSVGIKITRAITGVVMSVWNVFSSLLGGF